MYAHEVSIEKDNITITVILSAAKNGKRQVIARLSNNSEHILASYNRLTSSSEFQIKLLDAGGSVVSQEADWAETYVQIGSKRHQSPRGPGVEEYVEPGAKKEFIFNLEDAYGERAALGRTLEISWESLWLQETAETTEKRNADGKIVPRRIEKYHFPQHWKISASLPFSQEEAIPSDGVIRPDKRKSSSSSRSGNSPSALTPAPTTIQALPKTSAHTPVSPWWWCLLAILVLLLAWLGLRIRKKP